MAEVKNKKEIEEKKKLEEEKKNWNWRNLIFNELKREDGLFTSRVNLFLVAESLLFLSYIASLDVEKCDKCVSGIIVFLGLLITIFYLIILPRHTVNIDRLKTELEKKDSLYKKMKHEIMIPGYANTTLGMALPITFLAGWIALLAIKFCCCNC